MFASCFPQSVFSSRLRSLVTKPPGGFYNGQTYAGYLTLNSASPYGLYDMAGNVWQWVGDIIAGLRDRFLHGGSKDTDDMDLRVWARNSAIPTYYSPGVGFRCVKNP